MRIPSPNRCPCTQPLRHHPLQLTLYSTHHFILSPSATRETSMQRIMPVWPFSSASFLWRNNHRVFIISRIPCSGSHTISQIGNLRFWLMFVAPCYYPLCCETIWIHELSEEILHQLQYRFQELQSSGSTVPFCSLLLHASSPVTP